MKLRQMLAGIVLLAVLCLTVGVTQAQEKSYSANRFDSAITVEDGGSVLVTETVDFDFVGGPFTFVFRELPTDLTDGISVLEASVDGRVYPFGENPGQVEISTGNPMRITWHLEETSNATRTFVLTYRADGVVRREPGTNALYWQPLPDDYEYSIDTSTTVVDYPASASLISEPAVLTGSAEISQAANQVSFTTQNLQPNSTLIFMMQFEEGSLISAPPTWQVEQQEQAVREAEQQDQIPAWIAAALALFGTGFIGLMVYWRRHTAPSTKTDLTVMDPPGKLSPGLAGLLVSGATSPQWTHAQGTLFSLAEQGVLIIEELPEQKWYRKHDFAVKHVDQIAKLKPHENGLLDMLFEDKNGRTTSIKMSDMSKKISGKAWKKYEEPLKEDIEAEGFLSKSRLKNRTRLLVFGGLVLALGVVTMISTALASDQFGLGPLILASSIAILGATGLITGAALSPLSDDGAAMAASWNQFKSYLKAVSKGKRAIDSPTMFDKHLPYVAAFGLLHSWARRFEKEGWTEMPEYFHVLPTTNRSQAMTLFVVMAATSNSSGGSAAGAGGAGGGAAGGGASGAG
jgi:hypothetical protein